MLSQLFLGLRHERALARFIPTSSPDSIGPVLGGDASGNTSGSGPKELPIGLWPEVPWAGEDGAPPVLGELRALLGLGGFRDNGVVFVV
jgi:hypothetical protein